MTVAAILAFIGGILPVILAIAEAIQNARKNRKANRDALLKAESDELGAGMDATDKLQPPAQ